MTWRDETRPYLLSGARGSDVDVDAGEGWRNPAATAAAADASIQGLTLVQFSAQRKHSCGIRCVGLVDIWVITRHKLDTKRLTVQIGPG
jgi:hypothetical protein